jgi:hypothetical protein
VLVWPSLISVRHFATLLRKAQFGFVRVGRVP